MSWKTATEILATDPWLWVRVDGGMLNRRERGLHFWSHELHLLPAQAGTQPWEEPASAWTTQGRTLSCNSVSPFSRYLSPIFGGILRDGKSKKNLKMEFAVNLKHK